MKNILCNTLKEEGRAFRNSGKNLSLYCVTSLANFRLLFNLQLIRSSTARGSGTSILSRWSLQKLTSNEKHDLFRTLVLERSLGIVVFYLSELSTRVDSFCFPRLFSASQL